MHAAGELGFPLGPYFARLKEIPAQAAAARRSLFLWGLRNAKARREAGLTQFFDHCLYVS